MSKCQHNKLEKQEKSTKPVVTSKYELIKMDHVVSGKNDLFKTALINWDLKNIKEERNVFIFYDIVENLIYKFKRILGTFC